MRLLRAASVLRLRLVRTRRGVRVPSRGRYRVAVTEKQFAEQVVDLARVCHWKIHHDRGDYRNCIAGDAGFPDYVLVRRGRVIFAELKSEAGKLTKNQLEWVAELGGPSLGKKVVEVYIWRPSDLEQITRILAPGGNWAVE